MRDHRSWASRRLALLLHVHLSCRKREQEKESDTSHGPQGLYYGPQGRPGASGYQSLCSDAVLARQKLGTVHQHPLVQFWQVNILLSLQQWR